MRVLLLWMPFISFFHLTTMSSVSNTIFISGVSGPFLVPDLEEKLSGFHH